MGLHKEHDESYSFSDFSLEEDAEDLNRKKYLRRKLEERLERKRLKQEFDELDGEFDWDELDR
ncbi:hypothetical protein [Legionella spiritensis]|uniref:Uncharacterized protein n=1 Tax=Legionella spiritensis TaxID=452 RepID=A0A0W0Z8N7_LEGSP|nr:hypothetical protein [Legionella spiritensis]KTD65474.1 hypothetical protein Lspi_0548 [Legionella spiritensis]SNV35826.1 Uncharacterised protein [Legionella spiritensis]VEG89863.1 Uncharacterised protein [Legionella spiritensis]